MQTLRLYTGAMPEAPLFHVYLCALRGDRAQKIGVQAESLTRETAIHCAAFDAKIYQASDRAVSLALNSQSAPFAAFVAVYLDNPTPNVSGLYGAPMGRVSGALDHSDYSLWRATVCQLDAGGYDKGGAYWGLRARGQRLYAVQDGSGNVAFFDAANARDAIEIAKE